MRLIFMRHGIPDLMYGNGKCTGQAKCVGQTNYPLSAAGCGKIEKSALELKENNTPHVIYSSPLLRCVQSSCILRPYFDCGIYFAEGLAEIYMGEWENLLFSEIPAGVSQTGVCNGRLLCAGRRILPGGPDAGGGGCSPGCSGRSGG